MNWSSPAEFFAMGGYAFYVWGSFLVFALAVIMISVSFPGYQSLPATVLVTFWFITMPLGAAGLLSAAGGIASLYRKYWGLALAGSIASLLPTLVLGLAAIPLIVMSKREFGRGKESNER